MSSPKQSISSDDRRVLLETARASINHGLQYNSPIQPDPIDFPDRLTLPGASFVTLNRLGQLRGCIGSLEARQPLIIDVASNAYSAAFKDPRFPPLSTTALDDLELHIPVLSKPVPMHFGSEADLIAQLRPQVDGLILEVNTHRGTFLPSVWESLPEPEKFLAHLKLKAGLPMDYWSDNVRISRYHTEAFS